jgi:hypothetical protein
LRPSILAFAVCLPILAAAQSNEPPRVAWETPDPAYPLKVHILSSDRHYTHHSHTGLIDTESYGSGNLLGPPPTGFDYTSYCPGGFLHNAQHEEFYQGRWKQQDQKLEILIVETGHNKPDKCEIKITVKAQPYSKDNPPPHLVTAH